MPSIQRDKKKTPKKKKIQYTYSKKWNNINLLTTILLIVGTFLTVMFVSAKTYYDFRQRAAEPSTPIPLPTLIEQISPTPTPSPTPDAFFGEY